jgi:chorismate mutase-like protein
MKNTSRDDLARCRERIDDIDVQLVDLLNQRTTIVEEIGRIKQHLTLGIYEPKREEQVFENIRNNNHGPLPSDSLQRIFERIIDEMRTVQKIKMLQGDAGARR